MTLTKTLRMFGLLAVLISSAATQSLALPTNELEITYFSNASYTTEVGSVFRGCQGEVYREGKTSGYQIRSSTLCNRNGLNEIACSFDGRLTQGPANICDTGLVECTDN